MENIDKLFCVGFGIICFIVMVLFAFSLARMAKEEVKQLVESDPPADGDEGETK